MRRISKKRDIYFIDKFHLTPDEVTGLGTFVELVIMTDDEDALPSLQDQVQQAAQRLDLLRYPEETRSYRRLLFVSN
ncbi:MAG: CYTH domain-containing protein [Hyphomicrobiales bacterium]|nr:CYTH domain-containing protein [Hyphomicrobiales bacterium]